MQRKKNIRLMALLGVLVVAALVLGLTSPGKNHLAIDREMFAYDPQVVDRVMLSQSSGEVNVLAFVNGQWMLNDTLKADPQRVSVLFAILAQASVRRKAPAAENQQLANQFEKNGVRAAFYEGETLVKSFEVTGDEARGLTYYREPEGPDSYIMEIPGYRNYLAGIYQLDNNGWRYPRIFDFNWQNLQRVDVDLLAGQENFGVSARNGFYSVEGLPKTDTARLTEFLDNLSLLYVNDFISQAEANASPFDSLKKETRGRVIVTDVGNNAYTMDIMGILPGKSEILIRIDSSTYALASFDLLNSVLKPRQYFLEKEVSE